MPANDERTVIEGEQEAVLQKSRGENAEHEAEPAINTKGEQKEERAADGEGEESGGATGAGEEEEVPTTPVRRKPLENAFAEPTGLPSISNVESFVVSTVPFVPVDVSDLPPREAETAKQNSEGAVEAGGFTGWTTVGSAPQGTHFKLEHLWHSFEEGSAYGIEVPLVLVEGLEIYQYYVPFLSGLQLYEPVEPEEDGASEVEGGDGAAPTRDVSPSHTRTRSDSSNGSRLEHGSTGANDVSQGRRQLVFQYFERDSPYSRSPLSDAVSELAEKEPRLLSMRSDELHPSSWLSIAWYPIYRIPMGHSLRDLSACFLTYHSLSTASPTTSVDGAGSTDPCPKPPSLAPHAMAALRARARGMAATGSKPVAGLEAFGMAYYKLRGEVWHVERAMDWLGNMTDTAYRWLQKQQVIHPDFEFFSHHG